MPTFAPSPTARFAQLKGMPLAFFTSRAATFVMDFFLAFLLLRAVLIYDSKLPILLGLFHRQTARNF